MLDLALGAPEQAVTGLFLVAPDEREHEVRRSSADPRVRCRPYGELARHRDAMARFGERLKAIEAIARSLV